MPSPRSRRAGTGTAVPRSSTAAHQVQNLNVFDFALTASDMGALNSLPQTKVYNTQCQPWC